MRASHSRRRKEGKVSEDVREGSRRARKGDERTDVLVGELGTVDGLSSGSVVGGEVTSL